MFSDKSKILLCIVSFESGILLIYFSAVSPNMDFTIFWQAGRITDSARVWDLDFIAIISATSIEASWARSDTAIVFWKTLCCFDLVVTVFENN